MKKCFTINCMRNTNDFLGYKEILENNLYQAIEIFYPYNVSFEQRCLYTKNVKMLTEIKNLEVVLHLPHGKNNDLIVCTSNDENNKEIENNTMKRLFDSIDYARNFNVKKLTLHLGQMPKAITREEAIRRLIPKLELLCDYAEGMFVMIENMPQDIELGYSPLEIQTIITSTNKTNLKFILDTGHANCSKYELCDYVYLLRDYLYHLHFSDNSGKSDEHKRVNSGTIDFVSLFKALKTINYHELHCMEVLFHDYTDLIEYAKDIDIYDDLYK